MKAFMPSCDKNCTSSLERVVTKRNAVYLTNTLPSSRLLRPSQTHPALQRNRLQKCCTRAAVACRRTHYLAKYCTRGTVSTRAHRVMRNNVAIGWLETVGAFDWVITFCRVQEPYSLEEDSKYKT